MDEFGRTFEEPGVALETRSPDDSRWTAASGEPCDRARLRWTISMATLVLRTWAIAGAD